MVFIQSLHCLAKFSIPPSLKKRGERSELWMIPFFRLTLSHVPVLKLFISFHGKKRSRFTQSQIFTIFDGVLFLEHVLLKMIFLLHLERKMIDNKGNGTSASIHLEFYKCYKWYMVPDRRTSDKHNASWQNCLEGSRFKQH